MVSGQFHFTRFFQYALLFFYFFCKALLIGYPNRYYRAFFYFRGSRTLRGQRTLRKRLIIVFRAMVRRPVPKCVSIWVVKQYRCEAYVSRHRHQTVKIRTLYQSVKGSDFYYILIIQILIVNLNREKALAFAQVQ